MNANSRIKLNQLSLKRVCTIGLKKNYRHGCALNSKKKVTETKLDKFLF